MRCSSHDCHRSFAVYEYSRSLSCRHHQQIRQGNAIYLATESRPSAIGPVLNHLCNMLVIQRGPQTPEGVYARIVDGRTLYVNTTQQKKRVAIEGSRKGIITNRVYQGAVVLGPQEADLVQ